MAKKDRTGNRKKRSEKTIQDSRIGLLFDCYGYRGYRTLFLYRSSSGATRGDKE